MARQVVVNILCDGCLLEGEHEPAQEFTLAFGTRKPKTLALCERHEKEAYRPLFELFEKTGSVVNQEPRPVKVDVEGAEPKRTGVPKLLPDGGVCPSCGGEYAALQSHYRTNHQVELQQTLGQALGLETPFQCPKCPLAFTNAQAIAQHRKNGHTSK